MKRVLFITTPNIVIYQPKVYQEMSWGACLVAGALENAGYTVDYYELNAAMAKIRDDRHLSSWEVSVLTNIAALVEEDKNPGPAESLQYWLDQMIELIDLSKKYDFIAIALEKKGHETSTCRSLLHFTTMLIARLKLHFQCPVIIGGKDIFKELGKNYINDLFDQIPCMKDVTVFLKNSHESFPQELSLYLKGEGAIQKERFIDKGSSFKSSNVIPKYDVINRKDIEVLPYEIFPSEILKKYPQINDIAPMIISPYRISLGCPYTCTFCDQGRDPIVRIHEVENIVHTLAVQKKKGFENYRWYDDNINIGMIFPERVADGIINANLDILFSDSANMKHTSLELFKKLRKAGCVKLWYGSESMSPRILEQINKGTKLEDFYRTLNAGLEADIWNGLNLIVAFPHETEEDFQKMVTFLKTRPELYEAMELNIFRLISDTTMDIEADKFNIKIRYSSDSKRVSAFDEIGGMPWEERIIDAYRKRDIIAKINPEAKMFLRQNDYVLYSLIRAGFNKQQCLKIMDEIYDIHVKNGTTDWLIYNLERLTHADRTMNIGPHVMGLITSQAPAPVSVATNYRPY